LKTNGSHLIYLKSFDAAIEEWVERSFLRCTRTFLMNFEETTTYETELRASGVADEYYRGAQ